MSALIIGVHGVGNPGAGEIEREIQNALGHCNVSTPVREVNWNQIVTYPVVSGQLSGRSVLDLAMRLARASLMEWNDPSETRGYALRLMHAIRNVTFAGAELGLALLFLTLVWVIPVSGVVDFTQVGYAPAHTPFVASILTRTLAIAVAACLALFVTVGLASALYMRSMGIFFVTIRRALLVVFRPLILALYAIFVVRWRDVWKYWTQALLMLPLLVLLTVAITYREWWFVATSVGTLVALWVLTHSLAALSNITGGWTLKVLLDIFQYVSDPSYRQRILLFVDKRVDELCREYSPTHIVLVGHSLGSVISVDSLLHSALWADKRVTLVTCGSPLRGCFFRFFPGLYLPSSADGCSQVLAKRIKHFQWANFYRPFDYIGKRIGLSPENWLVEASTGQWMPWHTGYFGDVEATRLAVEKLNSLGFSDEQEASLCAPEALPDYDSPQYRILLGKFVRSAALAMLIILPVLVMGSIVFQGRLKTYTAWQHRLLETVATGLRTSARVAHYTEVIADNNTTVIVHHWTFAYEDMHGTPLRWKGTTGEQVLLPGDMMKDFLSEDNWHFNEGLVHYVKNHPDCYRGCTFDLPIAVNTQDPSYFVASSYLPSFGWWSQIVAIISHELFALICIAGVSLLGVALAPVFDALVGEYLLESR